MTLIYIIGSLSRSKDIETAARFLSKKTGNRVEYVKKEPNKDFDDLIMECFNKIDAADIIVVITKCDGTIGTGTRYEMAYAKKNGKQVFIIEDVLDCSLLCENIERQKEK